MFSTYRMRAQVLTEVLDLIEPDFFSHPASF